MKKNQVLLVFGFLAVPIAIIFLLAGVYSFINPAPASTAANQAAGYARSDITLEQSQAALNMAEAQAKIAQAENERIRAENERMKAQDERMQKVTNLTEQWIYIFLLTLGGLLLVIYVVTKRK